MVEERSEAAKKLSALGAAKGGRARAETLTAAEKSEIARKAVLARWAKAKGVSDETDDGADDGEDDEALPAIAASGAPYSLFRGDLEIGNAKIPVHVLNNLNRVIAQREVVRLLTGVTKGNLSRYLEAQYLRPYLDPARIQSKAVQFAIPGTNVTANGYEATALIEICDAYLRAREDGALTPQQDNIAKRAEIIIRASAKVGIIALIDEATGYQAVRERQALQIKFQAFIADDLQEWARMFPEEFWIELARLEGVRYSSRNRPLRWGRYVMMFVYDAIDKDIGEWLRKNNPDPHYKMNHHQWLKKFGRDKVTIQIAKVVTIMQLCTDMKDFRRKFDRVFAKGPVQLEFEDIDLPPMLPPSTN